MCADNKDCYWYTYFNEKDLVFHETCFLLTSMLPPYESIDTALSGPVDCSSNCQMQYNGETITSLVLHADSHYYSAHEIKISVWGSHSCKMRFLAVGGGGEGFMAGGGSGYIQYGNTTFDQGLHTITAKVGNRDKHPSVVTIDERETITAECGEDGHLAEDNKYDGGQGFSGGGGYPGPYNGGEGGLDGEGENGGSGTGEDVRMYIFREWELTPGLGGTRYSSTDGTRGGGGGGVMVNDDGPGNGIYSGQGYGGGGGGYGYSGEAGIILFEIESV